MVASFPKSPACHGTILLPPDLPLPKSGNDIAAVCKRRLHRIPVHKYEYMNIVEEDFPVMNTNFRHAERTTQSQADSQAVPAYQPQRGIQILKELSDSRAVVVAVTATMECSTPSAIYIHCKLP